LLAGPEVRATTSSGLKPFAHALVGAAHVRQRLSLSGLPSSDNSTTRFALALGGGFDLRLNDRLDLRVVQVGYNPIFFFGGVSHSVRVSAGIVIK